VFSVHTVQCLVRQFRKVVMVVKDAVAIEFYLINATLPAN